MLASRRLRKRRDERAKHPRYVVTFGTHDLYPEEAQRATADFAKFLGVGPRQVAITNAPVTITEIGP